ncbi:hypothetical protein OOK43_29325 [[Kitasatospora] papulosa]|uniref:hypothetical protein n=1 Tax=[Kitasatospora] papulosa TaxID=1464011 RepID=UPI00224ECADC|nr:hypothetical protein [[Kitasatospora] papulosa]
MTLSGISRMLRCRGWSHEVPALRAVERRGSRRRLGEGGVATPGTTVAALGAWIVFEDEAGFSMTPPTTHGGAEADPPRSSVPGAVPGVASP